MYFKNEIRDISALILSLIVLFSGSVTAQAQVSHPYAVHLVEVAPAQIRAKDWAQSLSMISRRFPGLVHLAIDQNAFLDPLIPVKASQVENVQMLGIRPRGASPDEKPIIFNWIRLSDSSIANEIERILEGNAAFKKIGTANHWWMDATGTTAQPLGFLSAAGPRTWRALAVGNGYVVTVWGSGPAPADTEKLLGPAHPLISAEAGFAERMASHHLAEATRSALWEFADFQVAGNENPSADFIPFINGELISLAQYEIDEKAAVSTLTNYSTKQQRAIWLNRTRKQMRGMGRLARHKIASISSFRIKDRTGATLSFAFGTIKDARDACTAFKLRFNGLRSISFKKSFTEIWPGGFECKAVLGAANAAVLVFWDDPDNDAQEGFTSASYRRLYQLLDSHDTRWLLLTDSVKNES